VSVTKNYVLRQNLFLKLGNYDLFMIKNYFYTIQYFLIIYFHGVVGIDFPSQFLFNFISFLV